MFTFFLFNSRYSASKKRKRDDFDSNKEITEKSENIYNKCNAQETILSIRAKRLQYTAELLKNMELIQNELFNEMVDMQK